MTRIAASPGASAARAGMSASHGGTAPGGAPPSPRPSHHGRAGGDGADEMAGAEQDDREGVGFDGLEETRAGGRKRASRAHGGGRLGFLTKRLAQDAFGQDDFKRPLAFGRVGEMLDQQPDA